MFDFTIDAAATALEPLREQLEKLTVNTTDIPVTVHQTAMMYEQTIRTLEIVLEAARLTRVEILHAEHKQALIEAALSVSEEVQAGKNAEARAAALRIAIGTSDDWQEAAARAQILRSQLEQYQAQHEIARERCRLYRAILATMTPVMTNPEVGQ